MLINNVLIKSSLFIYPNITNLPKGALQSVQHMTPSILRPSIQIRKKIPGQKKLLIFCTDSEEKKRLLHYFCVHHRRTGLQREREFLSLTGPRELPPPASFRLPLYGPGGEAEETGVSQVTQGIREKYQRKIFAQY